MASRPPAEDSSSARLVILVADLTGYTRLSRSNSDEVMAQFLDRFYCIAEDAITAGQGRIVKFMGDAVLAIFPVESAVSAVAAAVTLQVQAEGLASASGFDMKLGANLHVGSAVVAELGKGSSRRTDVVGRAVNQTFLLGNGGGIRLSEPMYRQLPSGERGPWEKHKPPAVYVLGEGDEPYAGRRAEAARNAMRW
jgi:class 3 adenylate cyclase